MQELKIITTNPDKDLITELQELLESGWFVNSVVQDVHSKGGYEAMYIAVVTKHKEFKPYPKKKYTYKKRTISQRNERQIRQQIQLPSLTKDSDTTSSPEPNIPESCSLPSKD